MSTTLSTPGSVVPPLEQQICVEAGIKQNFYSNIGNDYCIKTCQGKPMDVCNLYLCYCRTKWVSTRDF